MYPFVYRVNAAGWAGSGEEITWRAVQTGLLAAATGGRSTSQPRHLNSSRRCCVASR